MLPSLPKLKVHLQSFEATLNYKPVFPTMIIDDDQPNARYTRHPLSIQAEARSFVVFNTRQTMVRETKETQENYTRNTNLIASAITVVYSQKKHSILYQNIKLQEPQTLLSCYPNQKPMLLDHPLTVPVKET